MKLLYMSYFEKKRITLGNNVDENVQGRTRDNFRSHTNEPLLLLETIQSFFVSSKLSVLKELSRMHYVYVSNIKMQQILLLLF